MKYFHLILVLIAKVQFQWVQADHYPGGEKDGEPNIMLCCPTKNVISLKVPICIPTPDGGWEKESVDNCVTKLKAQCPEFNEAECMWQSIPCANASFPSCRLKYYAAHDWDAFHKGKRTWMEINYVNQYGTGLPRTSEDNYIIEIHRMVRDEVRDAFGVNPYQGDFPESVADSQQSGGIKWTTSVVPLEKPKDNDKQVCRDGKDVDDFCKIKLTGAWKTVVEQNYDENLRSFYDVVKHPRRTVDIISACSKESYETNVDPVTLAMPRQDVCKIRLTVTVTTLPITFDFITCKVRPLPKSNETQYNVKEKIFVEFKCYTWHDKMWNGTI